MGDKKAKLLDMYPAVTTALHVLKGAVVRVCNTPLTVAFSATSATKGKLAVEYADAEQPTPAQIAKIEELANQCIKANLPVQILEMERSEAEKRFEKGVNGTVGVPDSVTQLRILLIEDWNVNCTVRNVVKSTGELAPLKVERINFTPAKRKCEFCFVLGAAAETPKKGKAAGKAAGPVVAKKAEADHLPAVAAELQQILGVQASAAQLQDVLGLLSSVKATAYGRGFTAGRTAATSCGTNY